MNKKKLAKSVVGIALIVSVAILIVVCVGKIKHIQNKKNYYWYMEECKCRGSVYLSRKWRTCCKQRYARIGYYLWQCII